MLMARPDESPIAHMVWVLIAVGAFMPAAAADIVVDSFDTAQSLYANSANFNSDGGVSGPGIIGGGRYAILWWISGPGGVTLDVNAGTEQLGFTRDTSTAGRLVLTWGSSLVGDPLNVDLTGGGALDCIVINVALSSHPVQLRINVSSDASNRSEAVALINGGTLDTQVKFPFDEFSAVEGSGADFTDIDQILVEATSGSAGTLQFLQLEEIVVASCACSGDLNGDGFRSVSDFTRFASAYGSQMGDANYDPDADFNGDGFVNVVDFSQFAVVYGVPCP
jgi:hypothetical protein